MVDSQRDIVNSGFEKVILDQNSAKQLLNDFLSNQQVDSSNLISGELGKGSAPLQKNRMPSANKNSSLIGLPMTDKKQAQMALGPNQ